MRIGTWSSRTATTALAVSMLTIVSLSALGACAPEATPSEPAASGRVGLQSISPSNGATGVSITMPVAMRFSGRLGGGMERYIVVHEGSITGPVVAGSWSWSDDGRTLTFTPDVPLKSRTTYVVHMGGGMRDASGMPLDYGSCAGLGAQPLGGGMMPGGGMMGPGWQGAEGGHGMIFTFTTA